MEKTDVTDFLDSWNRDPKQSLDHIMPLVSQELRQMAGSFLAGEQQGHTLQATALVNELYLRLLGRRQISWSDRSHFFGFAARTMRRILVDHARARASDKRGAGAGHLDLSEALDHVEDSDLDLVALDEALNTLAKLDERQHRIVELRFFTGLNNQEIAELLGVGTATVQRQWASARAWLHQALNSP